MWKLINEILGEFRICFNRKASYQWFVIIVVGIMIRSDKAGITSIIRDLGVAPELYTTMVHFFRSSAWNIENLLTTWGRLVKRYAPLCYEDGMVLLVGDGVKQAKEAKKMPGVKKLHQESENSSKAEYIFGHMFGGIGVLAGNGTKMFCIPLSIRIHDGIKTIRKWLKEEENKGIEYNDASHVVQMIQDGHKMAKILGPALILLDRYFLSVPALEKLEECNKETSEEMHILTKAKISCTAYENPKKKTGKGRPPKKGETIKLKNLFTTKKEEFIKTTMNLYGKDESVEYLCVNLLWGTKLYKELRFVLVRYNGNIGILATTKLDMDPERIILLYSYRFKIECTFREFKQVIGGFSYHFWSKKMPKLNRFSKKGEKQPIYEIENRDTQMLILSALKAIEGYVMFSIIAMGLIQIISIKFSGEISKVRFRFLRTQSQNIVSEATVACFLRKNIFWLIEKDRKLAISEIINSKHSDLFLEESKAIS